jgi:transposase
MIIIGCDLHTRTQQIALLDTATGELVERRLEHENGEAKRFYAELQEPALVGMESTGYALWFAALLAELGHELVVGDAAKIRAMEPRKQKHDRRDAEHLLNLLVRGDFPRLWLPSVEERDVRVLLEHRHQLVELRTRAKNGLQAIALNYGLARRTRLWTERGQAELQKLPLREGMARRREDLLRLLAQLDSWIHELDQRLQREAEKREAAQRLMTHPGVGPLTALGTVLVLGPVERFPDGRHVTSYVGLIPQEESSGSRQRFGHLTKQGNRLLRFLLVEAAQSASRLDPALKRVYRRLAFRKGHASAKVAVARKLLIRLYIMLRDEIDYAEFVRRGSHAGMLGEVALA